MLYLGLFLLSAGSLAFEINLSRLFSVAQFYHFAFMVVSLALLGYGASGTLLSLRPELMRREGRRLPVRFSWGFSLAAVGAYALTVYLPFDSFRIAREWRQGLLLLLHYVALAAPFFCSGAVVGQLLAAQPHKAHRIYTANLLGSAAGCALAIAAPALVGGEGVVFLSAALGLGAALAFGRTPASERQTPRPPSLRNLRASTVIQVALLIAMLVGAVRTPPFLRVRLSPYKALSYLLQVPDAERIFQRWNGFSRVDVVDSSSIRGLAGSGFRCSLQPPPQRALTVDGDDVSYIHHIPPGFTDVGYTDCLLGALPYQLRPGAEVFILEPQGGADVVTALAQGARSVTVVEPNPLTVEAVRAQGRWAGELYDDPRVEVVLEEGRTFAKRSGASRTREPRNLAPSSSEHADILVLSLTGSQRTVTSGAYSLNEDYRHTRQAFSDYLARLEPEGLLLMTRWLQVPPSESIRAFALVVEALEQADVDPRARIVALRSYRQMLILASKTPFTHEDLREVRAFAEPRAFDLVYTPDLAEHEVNRHNVLPEPAYHRAYLALLDSENRESWYDAYPFNVRPPTDDQPFFGHFFRWAQAPSVLAALGRTWQPFGGAGYFVVLILLVLALLATGLLIVAPLAVLRRRGGPLGATLATFGCLGFGYLFVEIPLMQQFILFLGSPAYAMAVVLFSILLFSGIGSALSPRVRPRTALLSLPVIVGAYTFGLPTLLDVTLGAPLWARLGLTVVILAPPGLLMGIPFPSAVDLLERRAPGLIAWAWAVNGGASVIASILAALVALSAGFSAVLVLGTACYLGAWATVANLRPPRSPASPCP